VNTSDVPNHLVAHVIEEKTNRRGKCGICSGEIDTATSLVHDRVCVNCGTFYEVVGRDDAGSPEYRVVQRSTPEERIRRKIAREAHNRAVVRELSGGEGGDSA